MPLTAWKRLGRQIFIISDASGWWLGDWLIYGQKQYPDCYKRAIAETALDYQTLRNYAWVARRFHPSRRRARLSFQHHAEVASLPEQEQDTWLAQAERSGWSRNELRRQIKLMRDPGAGAKEITHIQMKLITEQKQLWQEAAQRQDQDLLAWIFTVLDTAASQVLDVPQEAARL
ncbi:hypothetical protein JOF53_002373 [Crossiella equi]|uniref:Uncharacterized protein n=1 Tax=Crossiella equi TaxID=130796 RepID=A0ABS5AAA1_9PSEU|nr:hypothetical protein [Crossiella equi]